jgi:predicted DNA-binding transcriptional regulator AlpA
MTGDSILKLLLSINEFVQYTGISKSSFKRILARGEGPRQTRVGRRIYFTQEAADSWLKSIETEPRAAKSESEAA